MNWTLKETWRRVDYKEAPPLGGQRNWQAVKMATKESVRTPSACFRESITAFERRMVQLGSGANVSAEKG